MIEEEIDLREYVLILLKYWKWIAGLTLIAAVVALIVSLLLPPTYEATALRSHRAGSRDPAPICDAI